MARNQSVAARLAKSVTEMHNIMTIRLNRNKQDLLNEQLTPPMLPVPVVRDLKGSHFQVLHSGTHVMQTMPSATAGLFFPMAVAISYQTHIARTVWNMKYNKPELWITPNRHSNSTAKHKGYILKEYVEACKKIGMTIEETSATIYETLAVNDTVLDRVVQEIDTAHLNNEFRYIESLNSAVRGGIHTGTRITHVKDALTRLNNSFNRLTRDVPVGNVLERCIGATPHSLLSTYDAIAQTMVDRMDFLSYLLTLPMNEMRVVIRAQLELDRN